MRCVMSKSSSIGFNCHKWGQYHNNLDIFEIAYFFFYFTQTADFRLHETSESAHRNHIFFKLIRPPPSTKESNPGKKICQGRVQDFSSEEGHHKGMARLWPGNKIMWTAENTYQTTGCSRFCITVLGSHRSSRVGEGGWGAHPLHPTPRSAPVCGFKNVLIRVDGAWVACVAADPRNVYTIGSVYTLYTGDLECLQRRRLGLS